MRHRASFAAATAACLFALATREAAAKSEVDRDTDDRHARAEKSSDDSSPSSSSSTDDHYDDNWFGSDPEVVEDVDSWSPPVQTKPVSGDILLRPQIGLDHPGGGFAIDVGFPYFNVETARRSGLVWRFELNYTRWLDHYRPEGALYTSTLDLLRISTALVYRHTWISELADFSLAIGPGFTMVRALESFDDVPSMLNETLIAGVTLGPNVRFDFHGGLFGGRAFAEAGFALTAAWASPYLDQYDSLISGLQIFMFTPRAGAGHFWAVSQGVELGLAYEAQTVGGIDPAPTFTHTIYFALRLSSYVTD